MAQPPVPYNVWKYQQTHGGPLAGTPDPRTAPHVPPPALAVPGATRPAPHDPAAGAHATTGVGAGMGKVAGAQPITPKQVREMQQFLTNHGFQVSIDGVMGPLTKSAAAAFRSNHKGGEVWNKAHGIGVHPAVRVPVNPKAANTGPATDGAHPRGATTPAAAQGPGGDDAFSQLLGALLASGGRVGHNLDPKSFGNAAAAPSTAEANAYQRMIDMNPKQEAQNQHDISSWYGLDPKADSYKLSVLGRLAEARTKDAAASDAAAGNVSEIAKSLASSIGGSANDGSAGVASAGADAAGTMAALGTVSKQYADDMNPLLAAEARGQMSRERGSNSQKLVELQDAMAKARGQAQADRASGVAGVTDKNNALAQQRFANGGNLLSTLAQLQAADPEYDALKNEKLKAQIWQLTHPGEVAAAKRPPAKPVKPGAPPKADIGKAAATVTTTLGYATDPTTGQAVVPTADHGRLARQIGAYLRSQGFRPGDGQFKRIGDAILSTFVDQHGRPIRPGAGWLI